MSGKRELGALVALPPSSRFNRYISSISLVTLGFAIAYLSVIRNNFYHSATHSPPHPQHIPPGNSQQILSQCAALRAVPGPPQNFHERQISDRFEPGTKPTLIRNATIWTGQQNGTVVVHGDLLFDGGVVKGIGKIPEKSIARMHDLTVVDAGGAWVTPGLGEKASWFHSRVVNPSRHPVDLHSHIGLSRYHDVIAMILAFNAHP
jgi:hypothetical protein